MKNLMKNKTNICLCGSKELAVVEDKKDPKHITYHVRCSHCGLEGMKGRDIQEARHNWEWMLFQCRYATDLSRIKATVLNQQKSMLVKTRMKGLTVASYFDIQHNEQHVAAIDAVKQTADCISRYLYVLGRDTDKGEEPTPVPRNFVEMLFTVFKDHSLEDVQDICQAVYVLSKEIDVDEHFHVKVNGRG